MLAPNAVGRELEGLVGVPGRERREDEDRGDLEREDRRRRRAAPAAMILRGFGRCNRRRPRRRRCPSPGRAPPACAARLPSGRLGRGRSHGRVCPSAATCLSLSPCPARSLGAAVVLSTCSVVARPLLDPSQKADDQPIYAHSAEPEAGEHPRHCQEGKRSQALIEPVARQHTEQGRHQQDDCDL